MRTLLIHIISEKSANRQYMESQVQEGNLLLDGKVINEFSPLDAALPTQPLVINEVTITSNERKAVVEGKISFLKISAMPATLVIEEGAPHHVQLTARLPLNWTWPDSFSNLPGSYRRVERNDQLEMGPTLLDDFEYRDPRWILANFEAADKVFSPGLNFAATAFLNNFTSVISKFFHWTEKIELSGTVRLLPQAELSPIIDLAMGSTVKELWIQPIKVIDLEARIRTTDPMALRQQETYLEINGSAVLDEARGTTQKVSAAFSPGNYVCHVHGEAPDDSLSLGNGVSKLGELLGAEVADLTLPDSLQSLGNVHLQRFDVGINFSTMGLKYIGIQIGSDETWTCLRELVQIGSLALTCFLYFPFDPKARSLSMLLSGRLTLGEKRPVGLDIYARRDEGYPAIVGNLAEGETIDLKSLVSEYVTVPEELPTLDVYFLNFYAQSSERSYSLEAGLKSDWTIDLGPEKHLTLHNVTFRMERSLAETIAALEAQLEIAGAWVTLFAENPADDTGWTFEGHARTSSGLTVSDLLTELGKLFDFDKSALALQYCSDKL